MKINITAVSIALLYNAINFMFWRHIQTMPNATSMVYVLIYPCFWIITVIVVTSLAIAKRKIWFRQDYRLSTSVSLFFCTPLSIFIIGVVNTPTSSCVSTEYRPENGHTIKSEEWMFNSGGLQVIKYWKANSEVVDDNDSSAFKKDSVWVYLTQKGDTDRIEIYKNGKLISKKKH